MADFIDKKFKDADPVDTVNRIKEILRSNNIKLKETWYESGIDNCYSLRVTVEGTRIGTNGKGITRELAAASGYAEFLERLQSGWVFERQQMRMCLGGDKPVYPDSVYLNREELSENCGSYFEAVSKGTKEIVGDDISPEIMMDLCFQLEGDREVTEAVPFYDVLEDKKVLIPYRFLCIADETSGLAAGNTLEEAIVEGFSEVVERYIFVKMDKQNVIPPTIPDSYLQNYETAYGIITQLRNAGFDVLIKDCSLGEGYPVIIAVIINKKNHTYHAHVGSSPVFEIALHRSLTEMFQGRRIDDVSKLREISLQKSSKSNLKDMRKLIVRGMNTYPIEFFCGEPSYSFTPFEDRSSFTNKELVRFILDYTEKKDHKLYVRDLSHLGFNTYRLVVPGMSECIFNHMVSGVLKKFPLAVRLNTSTYGEMRDLSKTSPDKLFELQMLTRFTVGGGALDPMYSKITKTSPRTNYIEDNFLGIVSLAYIEWACQDRIYARDYAKAAIVFADEESKAVLSCLCKLPDLYDKEVINKSLDDLSVFYDETVIDSLRSDFNNDQNPFEQFILKCHPENCDGCRYKDTCEVATSNWLCDMIVNARMSFDTQEAFKKLHDGFSNVRG